MTRTPTLTEVRRWNTDELVATAAGWTATARVWESAFTELTSGAGWQGLSADRARGRAAGDRLDAIAGADRLHAAAGVARIGADRIEAARTAVLNAVDSAVATGFTVDDDFTVSPAEAPAGRAVRADLSSRVNRLIFVAREVADEITSTATGLSREFTSPKHLKQQPSGPALAEDPRLPEDPIGFREIWSGLTQEQRDRFFDADDSIGNHGGMPFAERDFYNRRHLDRLHTEAAAEADALQTRFDDLAARLYMGDHSAETTGQLHDLTDRLAESRRRLDGYDAVRESLNDAGGAPHLLGLIDETGHAAVSIGDPDTAIRSAVFVPGTGQDLTTLGDNSRRALDMMQAALAADPTLTKSDVAVTTWMGYDRPMTLSEAAWPDRARAGGTDLDRFLDGMQASHSGPPAVDTVIGHSYGSTLVGGAATGGHRLAADNVIAVGSPGMLSRHAGELLLDPGAHVYSMTAVNDPISLVTSLTLGADPNGADYGAVRLATDAGPALPYSAGLLPGVSAHSSYWDEGNPGLANMGAIIAGLPPTPVSR